MLPLFPGILLYCKQNLPAMHFSDLLDFCSNRRDECYEKAWYEFERRYRKVIFGRIRLHLKRFNAANNISYVEDISSQVTERLLDNDCWVLQIFRGRDNEGKFINFLNIICFRITINYMKALLKSNRVDLNSVIIPIEDKIIIEELFDFCSETLRAELQSSQKSLFYIERDILVFLMRTITGFKSKEVAQVPSLNLNEHNVDIIMYRLSDVFKNKAHDKNH